MNNEGSNVVDWGQIAVAAIGASAIILPAWWAQRTENKKLALRLDGLEVKNEQTDTSHEFAKYFTESIEIAKEVWELLGETSVDRFFLLLAWNGKDDPTHCDGLVMMQDGKYHMYVYKNLELDTAYKQMLNEVKQKEHVYFTTRAMPNGMLKVIYDREGIESSMVSLVHKSETGMLVYASNACHTGELSETDQMRVKMVIGRISAHAKHFAER